MTWLNAPIAGLKPPVITQEPVDLVLNPELTGSLKVVASGSEPLSYQWYRNAQPVPSLAVAPGVQ